MSELVSEEARLHSAPRRLFVNGLELRLVTASFDEELGAVLDRFQGACRRSGGLRLGDAKAELAHLDTSLRRESDSEGVLACLDTGGPLALNQVIARLEGFLETGDLGDVGSLRVVRAQRGRGRTTVLALWTEGSAPLSRLFPSRGDAPGRDPLDFPRPPGTRRVLSAFEAGEPYALTVYREEDGAEADSERVRAYRASLEGRGWRVTERARGALVAIRSERTLVVQRRRGKSGRGGSWLVTELSSERSFGR